jgi:hypothetical protein
VVDVDSVAEWTGADPADPVLPTVLEVAQAMVAEFLGVDGGHRCPDVIQDQAVLQLASELWARRNAPGGVLPWAGAEGASPVRMGRDAMASVTPMLARYKPMGTPG